MEAGVKLWLLLALTVLLRLPFLNTPIQGDDHIYLTEAEHALIDPLHPNNLKYVFIGDEVDLRGHPHPPGNAWILAALLLIFGDVKEVPFHAAYIVFSLIAVWAAYRIASRFTDRPGWATLLFIAVPAFLVNGTSLEADLPFLAFWLASAAGFLACPAPKARLVLTCATLAAASMTAYQAIFLTPILAVYTWIYRRKSGRHWLLLLTPAITIAAWQIFTRVTTGEVPAGKLAGYLVSYGFLKQALAGAAMLLIHFWFIVFPALVPFAAVAAWRRRREPGTHFLLAWIAIFLACGLPIFFAGSARYLLPIAAPVAILASRLPARFLAPAFAAQLILGLGLAAANYQHWDGYRTFAASLAPPAPGHRIWVDNDWGLRYYLEARGALPAQKGRLVRPGDIIVTSDLGSSVRYTVPLAPISDAVIQPSIPLRLIGLESHSGYSTVSKGFWPFGISAGPADRVHARRVLERHPALEYMTPKAVDQIVTGIDPSDGWTSQTAIVALKEPATPRKLRVEIYVPENAKAHRITVLLDGREIVVYPIAAPGKYTIDSSDTVRGSTLELRVDRTFRVPPDQRDLGVVLLGAGFP
ncbi:MAG TPA: glycosyltransferase family 39 protein [Candidatus Acidoferrales bacterium]|nr:glycosyltransferase family 39 protein [Candidatus Acidoferrales bacterium]